jgi:His-Xaa-Ser system radical SAM maturase HxsC
MAKIKMRVQGKVIGSIEKPICCRIAKGQEITKLERANCILINDLIKTDAKIYEYAAILSQTKLTARNLPDIFPPIVHSISRSCKFDAGDIVTIEPSGLVRILFRIQSDHNALFLTEKCNSCCLMCSQPPKDIDHSSRIAEIFQMINLIDDNTKVLGITGGEPTLLRKELLEIISQCKQKLPATALHVLSNGRHFKDKTYVDDLGIINHPDLVLGIPIYSDIDYEHDYIVQSLGAFDQTISGLYNLAANKIKVEIRIVICKLNYKNLPRMAEFIYRNLSFTCHVALMGLEPIGFAVRNAKQLWVDPYDYRLELAEATEYLAVRGVNVSIFNHQHCILPMSLWQFSRKSISEWKKCYISECESCFAKNDCSGFFASSLNRYHSQHINALKAKDYIYQK